MTVSCTGLDLDDPDQSLTGFLRGRARFSDGHRLRFTGSIETGFRFKPKPNPVRPGYISFHSRTHDKAIQSYIAERVAEE